MTTTELVTRAVTKEGTGKDLLNEFLKEELIFQLIGNGRV